MCALTVTVTVSHSPGVNQENAQCQRYKSSTDGFWNRKENGRLGEEGVGESLSEDIDL